MQRNHEIDAVITWVDGSDPEFKKRLSEEIKTRRNISIKNMPGGRGSARFTNNNEIEHCIRGIRAHLPWIRKIHLVTDRQTPSFLTAEAQASLSVSIVDHTSIFRGYEWALPCFNSRSIETAVHRIPGLAKKHIYFNDDFIPIAATQPEDFFLGENIVVRGTWTPANEPGKLKTLTTGIALSALSLVSNKSRTAHLLPQMRAARIAGYEEHYIKTSHAPHPARTDTLNNFFASHKEVFEENIRHSFRHLDQFTAYPLSHHLEAAQNNLKIRDDSDCLTINFEKTNEVTNKIKSLRKPRLKFICIQGLEYASPREKDMIIGFLKERIPK